MFSERESYELLGGHADSWKEIKQIEKAGMAEDQKKLRKEQFIWQHSRS